MSLDALTKKDLEDWEKKWKIYDKRPKVRHIYNVKLDIGKKKKIVKRYEKKCKEMKNDTAYALNNHEERGQVLVINNKNFDSFDTREGSENDLKAITEMFVDLGFQVDAR